MTLQLVTRFRSTILLLALLGSASLAQERADFVSDASFIVGTYQPQNREHSPAAMKAAADKLLASLSAQQRDGISYPLTSPERRLWTNLPARENAGGIRLGDMNEKQVKAVCDLMATLFSEQGYQKMCNIMLADDQLLRGGRARPGFGTENFSVVLFGKPSETDPWAFQLDGHHVGVNTAIEGKQLTMSPSFIGTQPEAFKIAMKSYRPLAGEMDKAYALAQSLNSEQAKAAIVSSRRGRIATGPGTDGQVPKPAGILCDKLNEEQRQTLKELIQQWVGDLPEPHASERMKQIESEWAKTYFAWHGDPAKGSDISYTIQGPSLIIEYACQDLGGNPLDHLHTMYRDPTNEYGKQLKSNN